MSKTDKVKDSLDKAHDAVEIAKMVAPPVVRGRVQDVEDAIEAGKVGIGLFEKLRKIFKRK